MSTIIMNEYKLLQMLQICDSLFPIGAFTLSNGMETLVQNGDLRTSDMLAEYISNFLKVLPFNELGAAALAARADSEEALIRLDELLSAVRGPFELRMGSKKLCRRFLKTEEKIQSSEHLRRYAELIKTQGLEGSYGIAVGLFIKEYEIDQEQALVMYTYSMISAMVINAVKLIPLSQMDGQKILNDLFPEIQEAVKKALICTEDEIGIGGPGFDISSMMHETLYSRMYIS